MHLFSGNASDCILVSSVMLPLCALLVAGQFTDALICFGCAWGTSQHLWTGTALGYAYNHPRHCLSATSGQQVAGWLWDTLKLFSLAI